MKPFSFRLERILTYRKHREREALGRLIRIRNEYNCTKEALKHLAVERSMTAQACAGEGREGIDIFRFRMYASYLQKLAHDIETKTTGLKNTETKVKGQEAVVKRETVKRKALETLKDFRFRTHQEETGREEQKILDELVINKRWVQT